MNTRSSFSPASIFRALASRTTLALGLSLPILAATWGCGCGTSAAALDNYSCSCEVSTSADAQKFAYCGVAVAHDTNNDDALSEATSWAQDTCAGKNPSANCNCTCTDLGTACTTPTSG